METIRTHQYASARSLNIGQGDITRQAVDAIVNAANSSLQHGGGVALAIARRGGVLINMKSRAWVAEHGPVSHSHPAYTHAGSLPCKFVIHAVGPVWGEGDEEENLSAAILGSLKLAEELGLTSIAFPAISTGIYGFPVALAARIFLKEIHHYLAKPTPRTMREVDMVLYDENTLSAFINAFDALFGKEEPAP